MIRLQNVSKYYASGDNNVSLGLHNVSVEMKKGEIIGVVGESGSGKSTFLNVVSMLDTFEDGEVYYDGVPASCLTQEEIGEFRKQHIGFIFQNYNLIDSYTVLQNVLMPLLIKGVTGKEAKEKAKEIIKKVGLEHRMHHKGTKLSGGEKQRCVIARALASDSEILACDEPTGNLDSKTGREIIELIRDVAKDKLVIIVTHNYDELKDIITRRLTFADGNLIEDVDIKEADKVEDKLNEPVDYKFSFREKVKLSSKDILSTPKRSFLSFLIFLAISAFVAYLYTGLLTYTDSYADEGIYTNICKDRYIVTGRGNDPLDFNDLAGYDYYTNASVEDFDFYVRSSDGYSDTCHIRFADPSIKLKKGRLPENDNEIVLGIPERTVTTYYEEEVSIRLNNYASVQINFNKYDPMKDSKFKVVGYYYIDDTTVRHYLVTGNENFNKLVTDTWVLQSVSAYGCTFYVDEVRDTNVEVDDSLEKGKIKLILPSQMSGMFTDVSSIFKVLVGRTRRNNDITIDKSKYDLVVEFSGSDYPTVNVSVETLKYLYNESVAYGYVSIYETDQLKVDNMKKDLLNKGYSVCNAKQAYYNSSFSIYNILNTVLYAFYIVGVMFALIVVFFISYFILARIYSIKNKDYTVFRTLGMSKKDMASLVRIQTVIQSGCATLLILIAILISYIIKHPIIKGFHRIGIFGFIFYLVFMLLYSLMFAGRFNKKLYKFSVQKTFRGGVLGND